MLPYEITESDRTSADGDRANTSELLRGAKACGVSMLLRLRLDGRGGTAARSMERGVSRVVAHLCCCLVGLEGRRCQDRW